MNPTLISLILIGALGLLVIGLLFSRFIAQEFIVQRHSTSSATTQPISRWSGLQTRMTISYICITIAPVLLLDTIVTVSLTSSNQWPSSDMAATAQRIASARARTISLLTHGSALDPYSSYPLDNPPVLHTLNPVTEPIEFMLLIAPNGQVFASSYPQRYPIGQQISSLLPKRMLSIHNALLGVPASDSDTMPDGRIVYAIEPVWSKDHTPIGAIYVQAPATTSISSYLTSLTVPTILLMVLAPLGALFSFITTRGLVRRIRKLAMATKHFADGDYAQRVPITYMDEVGQLEQQFNRMAEQLVESIAKRQELGEQNARMTERARISRELHDAISQNLFSLRMLMGGMQKALPTNSSLQAQITTAQQTVTTTIREMRALLLELRPTRLEQLGLAEALEDLAAAYRSRLGIVVTTSITPVPLPAEAEHALLRIAQEGLSNAARHADARHITISLTGGGKENIELVIADDGKGFERNTNATQHGLGLRLMQERVQELDGAFELQATPSQGTQIHICLPRRENDDTHCHS